MGLQKNRSLQTLILRKNRFKTVGSRGIGLGLIDHTSLEYVDFNNCQIDSIGAVDLVKGIKSEKSVLKVILIAENNINDDAAEMLIQAIQRTNRIHKIDVSRNPIGYKSFTHI